MINFPASPALNDRYTYLGRTWVWNGSGWEREINAGQTVSVFISVGPVVELGVTAIPYTVGAAWGSINYV